MYCPGCGTQNAEQTKYCRGCGYDLKVISQTMKGHLPVVLASKIDAILDRRNEQFRRDSLLVFLFGVGCLLKGIFGLTGGKKSLGQSRLFCRSGRPHVHAELLGIPRLPAQPVSGRAVGAGANGR